MNFHTFRTPRIYSRPKAGVELLGRNYISGMMFFREMEREKAGVGAISSHKRFNVKRDACIIGNVIMFLAGAKGGAENGLSPPLERN